MTEVEKMIEATQRIVDKWLVKEEHRTLEGFISNFEELIGCLHVVYGKGNKVFGLYPRPNLDYVHRKELEGIIERIKVSQVIHGEGYIFDVIMKGDAPDYD